MLPVTKVIPKELLPIVGKPMIQFAVEEAINAGFKEIVFITNSHKNSIKDYFDIYTDTTLRKIKKGKKLEIGQNKITFKSDIVFKFIIQSKAQGLGHAIFCAKKIVGKEPFGIILPDMLLSKNQVNDSSFLKKMKKEFNEHGISSILLAETKKKYLNKYGVVKFENQKIFSKNQRILGIVEKPLIDKAPSRFYAAGRYILENEIFKVLKLLKPDDSGEIQLTDAINILLKSNFEIKPFFFDGKVLDCGDKLGYILANIEYGFRDKNFKKEITNYFQNNKN